MGCTSAPNPFRPLFPHLQTLQIRAADRTPWAAKWPHLASPTCPIKGELNMASIHFHMLSFSRASTPQRLQALRQSKGRQPKSWHAESTSCWAIPSLPLSNWMPCWSATGNRCRVASRINGVGGRSMVWSSEDFEGLRDKHNWNMDVGEKSGGIAEVDCYLHLFALAQAEGGPGKPGWEAQMENGPTYFVPSIIQFYPTVRLGTTILRLISVISTNQKWTLNAAGHLVVFANHPPQVWFHFQSYQHGLTVQEMLSKPIFQNVLEDPERRTRAVINLIAQTCWHSKMSKWK